MSNMQDNNRDEFLEFSNVALTWGEALAKLQVLADRFFLRMPALMQVEKDDIIQQVAVLLLSRAREGTLSNVHNPDGYMWLALKSRTMDRIRSLRRIRSKRAELGEAVHNAEIGVLHREPQLMEPVLDAMAQLEIEERELLLRCYIDGVSIGELAAEVSVSYSAMAVRLHRIKEKLRILLKTNQ